MAGGARARSFAAMTTSLIHLRAAQALLLALGGLVTFGSIYFSITDAGSAGDWAIGAWALAMAVAMLAIAPRLRDPSARRFAIALLGVHFVFGAVKVIGYAETEAATFMVADVVLIGLIASLGR